MPNENESSALYDSLLAANSRFYESFGALDIESMSMIWSNDDSALCIHHGWEPIFTWERIKDSWEGIFRTSSLMMFQIDVIKSFTNNDTGTVVCKENISSVVDGRATNFSILSVNTFWLEAGHWKLIYHHGSPV